MKDSYFFDHLLWMILFLEMNVLFAIKDHCDPNILFMTKFSRSYRPTQNKLIPQMVLEGQL